MSTTDMNETLRDAEFKDEKPLKTVEKIRNILHEIGMETTENWNESGVPYCYSLRVSVVGTDFGTNGKGLTKEFALASGYGELIERLQLGHITRGNIQKDGYDSLVSDKSEIMNTEELLKRNKNWYESYARSAEFFSGESFTPKDVLSQFADDDGMVAVSPYFCANTCTKEYLPTKIRLLYTTNGCAAGNTPEEAIVQAISEIVERKHKMRILSEDISVPSIPEEILMQYPTSYEIISYIRSKGFKVFVKDCSLGTKFPVLCVCFIDESTGRYHDHFGAYPIFEIALERALTECFQGRNINDFANCDDLLYEKSTDVPLNELAVEFVLGESKKKPNFFISDNNDTENVTCGFSEKNNKELFKKCLEFFESQGYDVLIRDCSCLGFPTYQVLIPGYSEVFPHRLSPKHNEVQNIYGVANTLRNPSSAKLKDMLALITYIDRNKKADKRLSALNFIKMARLAAIPSSSEENRLLAATLGYVYYTLEKRSVVISYINQLLPLCTQTEQEYLICLKRYLSMKLHQYDDEQIKSLLNLFHKQETVEELYSCLREDRNPLERFTLHCDTECDERCPLLYCCCQRKTTEIANIINLKMSNMDFEASAEILKKLL